jgi:ubiquinol-cytochrome c reductase cytochrome b subunit
MAAVAVLGLLAVPAGVSAWFRRALVAVLLVVLAGFFTIDAKVWGVIAMGVATLIFFALPWLDRSPVKSIRYKGSLAKGVLAAFVVVFLVLGYLGTQPVTTGGTILSQICTLLYFAFFLLMPWYSRMDRTRPEPQRVTG